MNTTIVAIAVAYVALAVMVLMMNLGSRYAWWIKAATIAIATFFFVEVYAATTSLLGWPSTGKLPKQYELLWVKVVEPEKKSGAPGAIYLWVDELDELNIARGMPRAYRLPYSPPLAEKANKAKDQIMGGKSQGGTAEDVANMLEQALQPATPDKKDQKTETGEMQPGQQQGVKIEVDSFLNNTQVVEFGPRPPPLLPPKEP